MGCNAEKLQIQTAEMCGLFSSLFSWARRLFANCSKLPQRIATIVWHNKGALRENGTDIPHNLRKVLPAKAHAGTFPCGCGRSSGAPQAHKKLYPFLCEAIARTADRLPNPSGPSRNVQGFLYSRQCRFPPPFHDTACFLFAHFSLKRQKAQGRRNCPCSRLLHTKPPRLPSRKPGRFVCFRGAFSGAHAKPCEGSFGKPRVCGEKARTLIVQNEPQGSPPRMRGKD